MKKCERFKRCSNLPLFQLAGFSVVYILHLHLHTFTYNITFTIHLHTTLPSQYNHTTLPSQSYCILHNHTASFTIILHPSPYHSIVTFYISTTFIEISVDRRPFIKRMCFSNSFPILRFRNTPPNLCKKPLKLWN